MYGIKVQACGEIGVERETQKLSIVRDSWSQEKLKEGMLKEKFTFVPAEFH